MIIGIVGSGIMGVQLSAHFLKYGYTITMVTGDICRKDSITNSIIRTLKKHYSCDDELLKNITITDSLEPIGGCEIVIETSNEDRKKKEYLIKEISQQCAKDTVIATNTSSISVEQLSKCSHLPSNVIGCHFFNPVAKMELVEIIMATKTSDFAKNKIMELISSIEKHPIIVKDSPGFIVNRLLLPQINEAAKLLENGVATIEDIDSAVVLGLNHPMGPFKLADFIGLDVCCQILCEIYERTMDPQY